MWEGSIYMRVLYVGYRGAGKRRVASLEARKKLRAAESAQRGSRVPE